MVFYVQQVVQTEQLMLVLIRKAWNIVINLRYATPHLHVAMHYATDMQQLSVRVCFCVTTGTGYAELDSTCSVSVRAFCAHRVGFLWNSSLFKALL